MMQTVFTLFPWMVVSFILPASLMFTLLIEPASSMFAWDKQPSHLMLFIIALLFGMNLPICRRCMKVATAFGSSRGFGIYLVTRLQPKISKHQLYFAI